MRGWPPLVPCSRFGLAFTHEQPEIWYRDGGGRDNYLGGNIEVRKAERAADGSWKHVKEPSPDISGTLSLLYETGEPVTDQSIVWVVASGAKGATPLPRDHAFDSSAALQLGLSCSTQGLMSLRAKVTEISKNHMNRRFRLCVSAIGGPRAVAAGDTAGAAAAASAASLSATASGGSLDPMDVAPALSNPVTVKSKPPKPKSQSRRADAISSSASMLGRGEGSRSSVGGHDAGDAASVAQDAAEAQTARPVLVSSSARAGSVSATPRVAKAMNRVVAWVNDAVVLVSTSLQWQAIAYRPTKTGAPDKSAPVITCPCCAATHRTWELPTDEEGHAVGIEHRNGCPIKRLLERYGETTMRSLKAVIAAIHGDAALRDESGLSARGAARQSEEVYRDISGRTPGAPTSETEALRHTLSMASTDGRAAVLPKDGGGVADVLKQPREKRPRSTSDDNLTKPEATRMKLDSHAAFDEAFNAGAAGGQMPTLAALGGVPSNASDASVPPSARDGSRYPGQLGAQPGASTGHPGMLAPPPRQRMPSVSLTSDGGAGMAEGQSRRPPVGAPGAEGQPGLSRESSMLEGSSAALLAATGPGLSMAASYGAFGPPAVMPEVLGLAGNDGFEPPSLSQRTDTTAGAGGGAAGAGSGARERGPPSSSSSSSAAAGRGQPGQRATEDAQRASRRGSRARQAVGAQEAAAGHGRQARDDDDDDDDDDGTDPDDDGSASRDGTGGADGMGGGGSDTDSGSDLPRRANGGQSVDGGADDDDDDDDGDDGVGDDDDDLMGLESVRGESVVGGSSSRPGRSSFQQPGSASRGLSSVLVDQSRTEERVPSGGRYLSGNAFRQPSGDSGLGSPQLDSGRGRREGGRSRQPSEDFFPGSGAYTSMTARGLSAMPASTLMPVQTHRGVSGVMPDFGLPSEGQRSGGMPTNLYRSLSLLSHDDSGEHGAGGPLRLRPSLSAPLHSDEMQSHSGGPALGQRGVSGSSAFNELGFAGSLIASQTLGTIVRPVPAPPRGSTESLVASIAKQPVALGRQLLLLPASDARGDLVGAYIVPFLRPRGPGGGPGSLDSAARQPVPSHLPFLRRSQLTETTVGDALAQAQATDMQGIAVGDVCDDDTTYCRVVSDRTLREQALVGAIRAGATPVASGTSEGGQNNPRIIASRVLDEYVNGPLRSADATGRD